MLFSLKALAIFEEDDIKGVLEPAEKGLEELKFGYQEARGEA